jgi:hypothetical protein
MTTTIQRGPRPLAVNLALIMLLVSFSVSLAPRLARAEWSDPFVCIKYGSEIVMLLLPLWFIFRGKNWARWFLAALTFAGFCLALPQLIRQFQEHSVWWVVNYRLLNLAQWLALVALFHPSTSEWFLRDLRKRRERQRRQAEVEAEVRKEYEQRLSETSDYWQKADIEAEVSKLVKERMKLIHDARAV